ncbi:MAG: hypothetical protein ACI814_004651 [Mariniblastus sp.]|jgi:hypothetical protein
MIAFAFAPTALFRKAHRYRTCEVAKNVRKRKPHNTLYNNKISLYSPLFAISHYSRSFYIYSQFLTLGRAPHVRARTGEFTSHHNMVPTNRLRPRRFETDQGVEA